MEEYNKIVDLKNILCKTVLLKKVHVSRETWIFSTVTFFMFHVKHKSCLEVLFQYSYLNNIKIF